MSDRHRLLRALLRQDLSTFVEKTFATLEPGIEYSDNWHIHHLCWNLSRVARGEIKRLIINVPPRSLKSITVTVAFTAWVLGHDPTKRILCVSYTEELARKLSIDARRVIESPWFEQLFPDLQLARQRDLELSTSLQGYRFASGVGGAVLGRGADLVVIDDPIKALDALSKAERRRVTEFYDNTLITRLNDKRAGSIVLVMQRLHSEDLVGHVMGRDNWEVVSLPALALEDTTHRLSDIPEDIYRRVKGEPLHQGREPVEVLEQIRRAQGSMLFQAQYQQDPVPPGGNAIQRSWLRFYDEGSRPSEFEQVVVSWDTASTLGEASDYSVGTVWGAHRGDYYLLDVVRDRFEYPSLRREILRLSAYFNASATLIENTELGRALAQDLRAKRHLRPLLRRPRFDKEARLLAQSARFEGGQVHLPAQAPWLAEYTSELLAFPNGKHDDQVDATSQALTYLSERAGARAPIKRRDINRRDFARQ